MSESQENNCPVNIYMKVVDATNLKVLYDSGEDHYFTSDYQTANKFLRLHAKDLSIDISGYSGDISSSISVTAATALTREVQGTRFRWSNLGSVISTIPGDITTVSRPSAISAVKSDFTEECAPIKNQRTDGNREPVLTSTFIDNSFATKINSDNVMTSLKTEVDVKMEDPPLLSNGDVEIETVQSATEMSGVNDVAKIETSDAEKPASDGGGNPSRGRGRKRHKNSTSKSELNDSKNSSVGRNTQQAKRLRKGPADFDSSSNEESMPNVEEAKHIATDKAASDPPHVNPNKTSTDATKTGTSDNSLGESSGSRILEEADAANLVESATLWGCIGIGEWVFARWRDKKYYSGKITQKGLNDTWHIYFEDGMDGVASETHILPIKIIGVNVKAVYSPDNIFRPSQATITGQKLSDDQEKAEYVIQCPDLPHTLLCQRKQLSLSESEAKELRRNYQSTLPKAADLSLDNILAGPRRRGVGSLSQSGNRKIVGGAFDSSLADDSILRDSGAGTPTPKKPGPSKLASATKSSNSSSLAELDSDDTGYVGTPSTIATPKTLPGGNSVNNTPKDTPKGAVKESAKKGKSKEKRLFDGYQFFLTASGGGDPSSSGDDAPEPVLPYDKDEYKESIETKGGKVIDSVGREKGKDNVFLISDSHARTVKYIYCLAAGIPCVSHLWIGQCLEQGTVTDWKPFELKSGWSLEENKVIPAHQKKPLKNLKVYVTAEQDDLYNYWKPVLVAAEANILKSKKKPVGVPADTEILVTDSSCSQEVLDMVKRNNIPLVKPEWLVQTIITGTRAAYTGHMKYRVTPSRELEEDDE